MTTKLSVRVALKRAAQLNHPEITHQTEEAAQLLLALADTVAELNIEPAQWTADDVLKATVSGKPLLARLTPAVTAAQFAQAAQKLTDVYCHTVKPAKTIEDAVRAVDWTKLTTDEALVKGLASPAEFVETIVEKTDVRIEPITLLITALSVRALLESSAARASDLLNQKQKDTVHFDRPVACPVCGTPAVIASVSGTATHGNVKNLYCTTCGAHWLFERIRCAACGDEAVSDLTYVHDEKDESRRLHVCKHCKAAFPTVFVTDAEQFDPDIDGIAIADLVEWYEEHREEEEAKLASEA